MAISKPATPKQLAANGANARKGTGPRTAAGKRRSRLNALRHGFRAQYSREAMADLGEDPAEFLRLRRDLIGSFQPANPVEALLVDDLAILWWKKRRADRASTALQWSEVERLEKERLRELHEVNRETVDESTDEMLELGLRRLKNCAGKFEEAYECLDFMLKTVEKDEYAPAFENACQVLWGAKPTPRVAEILSLYRALSGRAEPDESDRARDLPPEAKDHLLLLIHTEIRDLISEQQLFQFEHIEISPAMRRACLAPSGYRWSLMIRQENALERQIDRKVRLLLALQRSRHFNRGGPPGEAAERRNSSDDSPNRDTETALHKTKDVKNERTNPSCPLESTKVQKNEPKRTHNEPNLGANEPRTNPNLQGGPPGGRNTRPKIDRGAGP